MEENVLDDIQQEGTPLAEMDEGEGETPDSSPDNEPETVEPEQGEEEPDAEPHNAAPQETIPFHKHPRWKKQQEELETLRTRLEELTTRPPAAESRQEDQPIPEEFEYLWGPNKEAWQKWSEYERKKEERILQQAEQRIYQRQYEAQREMEDNVSWVNQQFQELVDDPDIRFDPRYKNDLLSIVKTYRPVTEDGTSFDFRAAYEIYKQLHSRPQSQAKKVIAGKTSIPSKGEKSAKDYLTSNDLRNKSWNSL